MLIMNAPETSIQAFYSCCYGKLIVVYLFGVAGC